MTGYRLCFSKEVSKSMMNIMKRASDSITYKRAQSVYLRSKFDYCPKEISKIVGLSQDRVRHIHSSYKKYGEDFIYCGKRGGRNNFNLTLNEEQEFLKKYESISLDGDMITATSIHSDLESFLSKSIHKSVIYKMLKRNGWRKVLPRPQNPNHDQEAINPYISWFVIRIDHNPILYNALYQIVKKQNFSGITI